VLEREYVHTNYDVHVWRAVWRCVYRDADTALDDGYTHTVAVWWEGPPVLCAGI